MSFLYWLSVKVSKNGNSSKVSIMCRKLTLDKYLETFSGMGWLAKFHLCVVFLKLLTFRSMQYSLSSFWQGQIIKMNVKDNEANWNWAFVRKKTTYNYKKHKLYITFVVKLFRCCLIKCILKWIFFICNKYVNCLSENIYIQYLTHSVICCMCITTLILQ